jgi:hypothetical protein
MEKAMMAGLAGLMGAAALGAVWNSMRVQQAAAALQVEFEGSPLIDVAPRAAQAVTTTPDGRIEAEAAPTITVAPQAVEATVLALAGRWR